jgi:hypothetical protein
MKKYRPRKLQTGGVYASQAEVEAANQMAQRIAYTRHVNGTNPLEAYAAKSPGDPVVPVVYQGFNPATRKLPLTVPNGVRLQDIQSDSTGSYYYPDPNTGDLRAVDPSVVSSPKFQNERMQGAITMKQMGGSTNPYNWAYGDNQSISRPQGAHEEAYRISPEQQTQFAPITASKAAAKPAQPIGMDPYFALRGSKTAAAWIGNMMENKRQDQYMYNQMSTLGQLDPMPSEQFQPNPFSLYAKYGGKMKAKCQTGGLTQGLAPHPSYGIVTDAVQPTSWDSSVYLNDYNTALRMGPSNFESRYVAPAAGLMVDHSNNRQLFDMYGRVLQQNSNILKDVQNYMPDAQVSQQLRAPLSAPKDVLRPKKRK